MAAPPDRGRCPCEVGSATATGGEGREAAARPLAARGRVDAGGAALATARASLTAGTALAAGASATAGATTLIAVAATALTTAALAATTLLTIAALAATAATATAALTATALSTAAALTAAAATALAAAGGGLLGLLAGGRLDGGVGDDALARGEIAQHVAGHADALVVRRADVRLPHEVVDVLLLVRRLHRDDGAALAGAGRAARAVKVRLVLDRRIGVDHEAHLVHVDAARGDVGAHERRGGAVAEGLEVAGAGALGEVAVELHGAHALGAQLAGHVLRPVFGAGEHDGAAGGGGEIAQHVEAVVRAHLEHVVLHGAHGARRRIRGVGDGLVQELLDELVHAGVEGRGEQHPLALLRGRGEDAAHHRQEAHVGHVVGLVDDGDLDAAEVRVALAHEVQEAARAGDEHVDAAGERLHLRVLAHAAEHDGAAEAHGLLERSQRLGDLGGQLAGGGEDQGAGTARGAATRVGEQSRDERQQEGVGLAGAGAATAQQVAAGEGVRQRGGLDGGGGRDALRGEGGDEVGGDAELGEVGGGQRVSVLEVRSARRAAARRVREAISWTRPPAGAVTTACGWDLCRGGRTARSFDSRPCDAPGHRSGPRM